MKPGKIDFPPPSDLEEIYDKLSQWINMGSENTVGMKRDNLISEFASCLMKRAFSDSFADKDENTDQKKKLASAARSVSLELVKQNPKLAAKLVSP